MRRGRAPSRELSGSGGPQWDDPNGQLPGTGIPGDTVFFFLLHSRTSDKALSVIEV